MVINLSISVTAILKHGVNQMYQLTEVYSELKYIKGGNLNKIQSKCKTHLSCVMFQQINTNIYIFIYYIFGNWSNLF